MAFAASKVESYYKLRIELFFICAICEICVTLHEEIQEVDATLLLFVSGLVFEDVLYMELDGRVVVADDVRVIKEKEVGTLRWVSTGIDGDSTTL